MIPAATIHAALAAHLLAQTALERVEISAQDDLPAALTALRDSSELMAVLVPTGEEILHETLPDNTPLKSEIRSRMSLLLASANPERRPTAGEAVPLKDQLLAWLMWHELSLPGLLLLPLATEPVRLEFDNGPARDAWRIDLEARQILTL